MNQRWYIVSMLFVASAINYVDRVALPLAAPVVTREMGIGPAALGVVFSSFFVGYAVFCFVGGYFSDRIGPKRVIVLAMTVWSVFCGLTGAAFGIGSLLLIRLVFGFGEGPFPSSSNKIVSNWFGPTESGRAMGIAFSGSAIGAAVASPVMALLIVAIGWRAAFAVIGCVGLVWVLVWALTTSDRPASPAQAAPLAAPATPSTDGSIGPYLRQPFIIVIAIAFFAWNYILYFFLSWFPSYLTTAKGLSLQNMSMATVVPWVLGFFGYIVGGALMDAVVKRSENTMRARRLFVVTGLVTAALCVVAGNAVNGTAEVVALMAVAIFAINATGPAYWTILQDAVPSQYVGGVTGFVHFLANTAGIVAPALTGVLVQYGGGYVAAFVVASGVGLLGAAAMGVFGGASDRIPRALVNGATARQGTSA